MVRGWLLVVIALAGSGCGLPRPVDEHRAERARQESERRPKEHADGLMWDKMAQLGHDFAKETDVEFLLYFPEEAAARGAADVMSKDGYAADVEKPMDEWLCTLRKRMVLKADDIDMERTKLSQLATSAGGRYDGWFAEVKK